MPNAKDKARGKQNRYEACKNGRSSVNFVSRTKWACPVPCFAKAPELSLPGAIAYIEQNANGAGLSLEQLLLKMLSTTYWRPAIMGYWLTYLKIRRLSLKSRCVSLVLAHQSNCTRLSRLSTGKRMALKPPQICVEETVEPTVDGFDCVPIEQYHELRLEDGRYVQRVWVDNVVIDEFGRANRMAVCSITRLWKSDQSTMIWLLILRHLRHCRSTSDIHKTARTTKKAVFG